MTLHTCTECVYDVEPGWVDGTGYIYTNGAIRLTLGVCVPMAKWPGTIDRAIDTFRVSTPGYEVVARGPVDGPVPGAEVLAHRFGGELNRFELNLFWPLGDDVWVCRIRGPLDSEDVCRQVLDRFIQTYQPVAPLEASA